MASSDKVGVVEPELAYRGLYVTFWPLTGAIMPLHPKPDAVVAIIEQADSDCHPGHLPRSGGRTLFPPDVAATGPFTALLPLQDPGAGPNPLWYQILGSSVDHDAVILPLPPSSS
ncbi:hypothetical protein TRIUR3_18271 [Triticum urartu]|uniref:Uncharacterized protein n=1 Tax=Triticum urartu TaxID=4572 RepID=M8A0A0_TRIUA|nr:hypothetical protein TRIUR3_18271 [Triticum urartu]